MSIKPFEMPVIQGNRAYTEPPHRFSAREYFVIEYETDPDAIKKILPPGLTFTVPVVKYEFMSMPDASGFGRFKESGQIISVDYNGIKGSYIHSMYLDLHSPVAGGREIWGFPKTMGNPTLDIDGDYLLGTLDYGRVRVATGTMEYKRHSANIQHTEAGLKSPSFLVKSIPHADGRPAICQLVRYVLDDVRVHWAWAGEATLELHPHVMARVNDLPVIQVLSGQHFCADVTLPFGEIMIDYLTSL